MVHIIVCISILAHIRFFCPFQKEGKEGKEGGRRKREGRRDSERQGCVWGVADET